MLWKDVTAKYMVPGSSMSQEKAMQPKGMYIANIMDDKVEELVIAQN